MGPNRFHHSLTVWLLRAALRVMADVDAALVQQILYVPKRQREFHILCHRKANDVWRGSEPAKLIMGLLFARHAHRRLSPTERRYISADNRLGRSNCDIER